MDLLRLRPFIEIRVRGLGVTTPYGHNHRRIYAGQPAELWFRVLDVDETPLPLRNRVLTLRVLDSDRKRVLERDLDVVDEARGLARLSLTAAETAALQPGGYRWSVTMTDDDGDADLLYSDHSSRAGGTLEVLDDLAEAQVQPHRVEEFVPTSGPGGTTIWSTAAIPGPLALPSAVPLFTVSATFSDFTGTFAVQASVQPTAPKVDSEWFTIGPDISGGEATFSAKTGVDAWTWRMDVRWIRVRFTPDIAFPDAKVTKVLVLV